MEPAVTQVTANAESADELSEADYRDIFREIREKMSLREFVEVIESQYSIAWWGKYEHEKVTLTRTGKGELRRAVKLAKLPLTVTEVTAAVDPDARVWQVGDGQPDRVVLVGRELHEPVLLRLNGNLQVVAEADEPAEGGAVTALTTPRMRRPTKAIRLSPERWERLQMLRKKYNMTWDDLADRIVELSEG